MSFSDFDYFDLYFNYLTDPYTDNETYWHSLDGDIKVTQSPVSHSASFSSDPYILGAIEHTLAYSSSERADVLYPKKVIFNDPATIVFWKDGTKTIVKCMNGEKFDEYSGFTAALAKKIFGSSNVVKKIVKNGYSQSNNEA